VFDLADPAVKFVAASSLVTFATIVLILLFP